MTICLYYYYYYYNYTNVTSLFILSLRTLTTICALSPLPPTPVIDVDDDDVLLARRTSPGVAKEYDGVFLRTTVGSTQYSIRLECTYTLQPLLYGTTYPEDVSSKWKENGYDACLRISQSSRIYIYVQEILDEFDWKDTMYF